LPQRDARSLRRGEGLRHATVTLTGDSVTCITTPLSQVPPPHVPASGLHRQLESAQNLWYLGPAAVRRKRWRRKRRTSSSSPWPSLVLRSSPTPVPVPTPTPFPPGVLLLGVLLMWTYRHHQAPAPLLPARPHAHHAVSTETVQKRRSASMASSQLQPDTRGSGPTNGGHV
jgi:hypothetical protein